LSYSSEDSIEIMGIEVVVPSF